jgi:hypothetical protein
MRLESVDTALIGVFCALWAALSLTLGPLSFRLFNLPILCDFAVFFSLLLVTWTTGKFGTASAVGIIGSVIVLIFNPSPHIIAFAASAILFDMLMAANHHRLQLKTYNMTIASLATAVSAYFAGVAIGIFFMGKTPNWETVQWALTFWGVWHLIGGVIAIIVTLPMIGILERAHVREIKSEK